jgi:hypothetical protein
MSKPQTNYKLEQIARFVVPNLPETENGELVYKLKCVTTEGKLVEKPCTKQAWADFQRFHPETKTKVFFYLKVNAEGLVCDYNEVLRPPPAGMFKQEMPDGRIIDSPDRLIFERKVGDKEFDPVFTPDMVQVGTVADILAALNAAPDSDVSDKLLGKYSIYEKTQRAGREVVIVDIGR